MENNESIKTLKGIGDKSAGLFNKLGLFTCRDLVFYFPRAYDKYEEISLIKNSKQYSRNAIYGTVKNNPVMKRFNGKSLISFFVFDGENTVEIKYFNSPFMAKAVKAGDKKVFRGYLKPLKDRLVLDQPKIYSYEEYKALENTIIPLYPLTKDLSNNLMIKSVKQALLKVNLPDEYLTKEELNKFSFADIKTALSDIHFPKDENAQYLAKRRIVFEEFIKFVSLSKKEAKEAVLIKNPHKIIDVADCGRLIEALPYKLTNAQIKAINEISEDLSSEYLMNRLVQGDVGSGKTIVAIVSMLKVCANGLQSAMMAPTEVLARQHFENIKALTDKYNLCFKPVLLTGKMSAKDKKEALNLIATSEANIVLGTHAILEDKVLFKNLALVITDEQHRFGVKQREAFIGKGISPHLLVMSATPIPRTLAMILFAGLSVSVIDELPKNRIPISNCVVNSSFREKAYIKIKKELDAGHQAYVICPMVSESEEEALQLKSVEKHSRDIKEYFGETVRVGTLTGKMKPYEKTRIMEAFKDKNIDILVSTTVIEVGIDVPNATVILIENAERFGLSQLHQLRGRVGRGNAASFCILLSDSDKKETLKRLYILNETNDGFKIAKEDLKMRGPGELNGFRQSGELQFGLGDIQEDADILLLASQNYDSFSDRIKNLNIDFIDFRTI